MRILLTIFVMLALAFECSAQALNGGLITAIGQENRGPGRVDESYVTAHTRVRSGDELDRRNVNRDVKALLDTGQFTSVAAKLEPFAGGVKLTFQFVTKNRLSKPPEILGLDHMRHSKARRVLDLDIGDFIDDQIAGARAQELVKKYEKDFYPDAKVTWAITQESQEEATASVVFTVDEGDRARVGEIIYEGNSIVSAKKIHSLYKEFTWYNPFSWISRARYEPAHLEERRNAILNYYRDLGFLDAEVPFPDVRRNDKGKVVLTFIIREGVQYRFGNVRLAGSGLNVFPEADLQPLVDAEPNSLAGQSEIQNRSKALRDYFGGRGYINTSVKTVSNPSPEDRTVDLIYVITEGELVKIRNIVIQGNTRTRDKVIRRELLVYPGEIYNEVKVARSERIAQNLGFFSSVHSEPVDTNIPDEKDMVLSVEEKRTGQFLMGAGFSSVEQIMGFVEVSQGNFDIAGWPHFTGGGQKIKVRAEVGSSRNDLEISFVEPWFLNRKLSLGVDAFRSSFGYTDYDEARTGAAISLGKALPGPNRINIRYQIEENRIEDVADTNVYFYVEPPKDAFYFSNEDRIRSSVRLTLSHDTRNNPFITTKGNYLTMFGEVAGGPFGFDTDEFQWGLQGRSYFPLWFDHVLSFRARTEVIDAFGDTKEVPLVDRLFLGGGKTLRGFKFRDVGPKGTPGNAAPGSTEHRPAGGQTLAVASAEYTIPIVDAIRLAAFYDIGNVWRDPYDFGMENLASSTGVGIRFDLPGFPIRIDRAWAVNKDNDLTRTEEWVLWVGF